MRKLISHVKVYIFRGLLATIPIALTIFVLRFLYIFIDQKVMNLIDSFIKVRIPGLGLVIFLVTLYLVGYLASNVVGRQLFNLIEGISARIPIIKTTYQVGKQLSSTLSLPEQEIFKKAVLLDYLRPGFMTIGFVTGSVLNRKTGEKLLKVFIPTVPNPTSGLIIIVKESDVIDPAWSVEQAMKAVISGGIIGPQEIEDIKRLA